MRLLDCDFSKRGRARVLALTVLGTLACVALALALDSYSFASGEWHWGDKPLNDFLIPLVIAPPFFVFLLSKLRELAIAHDELMNVASTDGLTSLLNRRAFTAMVDGYLERVGERPAQGALLVVDVDHFKMVNDRFGHECGDNALKLIAEAIRHSVREIDLVGRIGGEEFGIFIPGLAPEQIAVVAERMRVAVGKAPFMPSDHRYPLSISVGGATFSDRADFGALYRCADRWLYHAKSQGRNRVEVHSLAMPVGGEGPPAAYLH